MKAKIGRMKLLIATENTMFRECLASRLSQEKRVHVTTAAVTPEILDHLRRTLPDVLLFDLDALGPLPESLLTRLRYHWPGLRILAMTERGGEVNAARILRAGAMGFISKDEKVQSLLRALEAVARGEIWAGRRATARALSDFTRSRPVRNQNDLTPREGQLLALLKDGYRNKELAKLLKIEERTVKAHLHSLYKKLKVRSRVEAALQAAVRG
jgi:DNA-binding NarL/FixJ family response regulator